VVVPRGAHAEAAGRAAALGDVEGPAPAAPAEHVHRLIPLAHRGGALHLPSPLMRSQA